MCFSLRLDLLRSIDKNNIYYEWNTHQNSELSFLIKISLIIIQSIQTTTYYYFILFYSPFFITDIQNPHLKYGMYTCLINFLVASLLGIQLTALLSRTRIVVPSRILSYYPFIIAFAINLSNHIIQSSFFFTEGQDPNCFLLIFFLIYLQFSIIFLYLLLILLLC